MLKMHELQMHAKGSILIVRRDLKFSDIVPNTITIMNYESGMFLF